MKMLVNMHERVKYKSFDSNVTQYIHKKGFGLTSIKKFELEERLEMIEMGSSHN